MPDKEAERSTGCGVSSPGQLLSTCIFPEVNLPYPPPQMDLGVRWDGSGPGFTGDGARNGSRN